MVQAAIRWVATGPPTPAATPDDHPPERPTAAPLATAPAIVRRVPPSPSTDSLAPAPSPAQTQPTPRLATPVAVRTSPPIDALARPVVPAAMAPRHDAHAEVVEVSIGAIHVRVDAPAVQTRAPQPPPAAPARPPADRASARSGLARRALRRL
jgi:hypothetical protein